MVDPDNTNLPTRAEFCDNGTKLRLAAQNSSKIIVKQLIKLIEALFVFNVIKTYTLCNLKPNKQTLISLEAS